MPEISWALSNDMQQQADYNNTGAIMEEGSHEYKTVRARFVVRL